MTFVVFAALLALYVAHWFHGNEHTCLRCGGKGAHRDDCPLR